MTIGEFIYGFDDGSTYAEYDEQGNVYIYDNTYDTMMAQLGIDSSVWEAEDDTFIMSPSLLRLMAELADTPPAKRKGTPRYVILNGEPEQNFWLVFTISDYGSFNYHCLENLDRLSEFSYTKEELDELKEGLSSRMQKAIDILIVPLKEALKMGEDDNN